MNIKQLFSKEIPDDRVSDDKVPDYQVSDYQVSDKVYQFLNVTDNQMLILNELFKNNKLSMSDLALKIGISKRKILDNINKLKEKGLLERIGNNKTGYWKLINQ
ncbi:MAG: winged helix-turn-helix domain-containing protein [Dysgonamonadaceae bacterium]|nr:winged helix-turn-helix domain-containing protein [Dysgonamonadaceae bacterium]